MTYRLIQRALSSLSFLSLIAGIGITMSQGALYADLTGVGSMLVSHGAAPDEPIAVVSLQVAEVASHFIFGILLIVLGFFIHGLVRSRDERHVHITVKPSKKHRASWFWVQMKV